MNEKRTMTDELFNQLIKEDYWIDAMSNPTKCYDKFNNFKYYKACSYPVEYIITEDQISEAKKRYAIRKKETLSSISNGELVFCAMGMDFKTMLKNGVGNYRIRCYFKNSAGHKYFIELSFSYSESNFYVESSVDEDLHKQREKERDAEFEYRRKVNGHWLIKERQDYYNCFGVGHKNQDMPFTFDNIVKFVNDIYRCSYKSARLIKYFASCEEWCCKC